MKKLTTHIKTFSLCLLLGIGACTILRWFDLDPTSGRAFSHKLHLKDQDLQCESCHAEATKGDLAGMPSIKKCNTCHEGVDENKPNERKLAALVGENPQWTNVTAIPADVRFSHKTHLDKKVACGDCHRGIEENTGITAEVRVSMESCMACHASQGKTNDCASCHKEIRKENPPPSHRQNWKRNHGVAVRTDAGSPEGSRCSLCHTESSCTTCHRDEPPQNHTNFWRIQGHGVSAQVDRSACAVCHKTDSCDRCHQETAPRSHTASWGSTQDRHCLSCHFPLAGESCAMCHKGTPSHALATPKPAWHTAGMNCRQCHGLSAPMPHPDNGDNCSSCHP